MLRRILATALVAAIAPLAAGCGDTAVEPRLETVDVDTFAEVVEGDGVVILDVRTADEYRAGHLAGAENIDYYGASFQSKLDALDKDRAYAIYCRTDNRSGDALRIMSDLGFTDVRELDGGIVSWVEAGLPLGP